MNIGRTAVDQETVRFEAERLSAIWHSKSRSDRGTQAEFGERFDIGNQSAVGQFLRGETPLSIKAARGFDRGLQCEIADFSPRLAEEAARNAQFVSSTDDDFVDVPRIAVRASAGHGSPVEVEDVIGSLKFARSFLRSCGVRETGARVIDVHGASMEPTIKDGAVLLISTNNREPVENQIFALVRPSEGVIVKRLVRVVGGQWIARSDNRDFEDFPIADGEPISIVGRAVWMGVKL